MKYDKEEFKDFEVYRRLKKDYEKEFEKSTITDDKCVLSIPAIWNARGREKRPFQGGRGRGRGRSLSRNQRKKSAERNPGGMQGEKPKQASNVHRIMVGTSPVKESRRSSEERDDNMDRGDVFSDDIDPGLLYEGEYIAEVEFETQLPECIELKENEKLPENFFELNLNYKKGKNRAKNPNSTREASNISQAKS